MANGFSSALINARVRMYGVVGEHQSRTGDPRIEANQACALIRIVCELGVMKPWSLFISHQPRNDWASSL